MAVVIAAAGCLAVAAAEPAPPPSPPSARVGVGQFIVISDLHYDGSERETQSFPEIGRQDSNLHLITSALQDAHHHCPAPMFILCPGDVLAHFNQRVHPFSPDSGKEQSKVAGLFKAEFPNVPVLMVLGNDDSGADDQVQSPGFLGAFSNAWYSSIFNGVPEANRRRFSRDLLTAGYYVSELPGLPNYRVLGLNTAHFDALSHDHSKAQAQIDWLLGEIRDARHAHKRLWLLFHIPPGMDPYRKVRYWVSAFQGKFLEAVSTNTDVVAAMFCGHTHRDEFRLIYRQNSPASFIHIAPAVSPIYTDYPAYQVFQVNTNSGQILDYTTYYLSKKFEWEKEYSFYGQYGFTNYALESVARVENGLSRADPSFIIPFRAFYSVSDVQGQSPALNDFSNYLGYVRLDAGK